MKQFLADPVNNKLYKACVKNIEKSFQMLCHTREELVDMYPEFQKIAANTDENA